jgi:hypothetical protein
MASGVEVAPHGGTHRTESPRPLPATLLPSPAANGFLVLTRGDTGPSGAYVLTMPLDASELQHLTAASGYLELGMPLDADAELDRVDPLCRHLPEVLELRCRVYRRLKKWELMRTVAKRLADHDPTRRRGGGKGTVATRL